LADLFTTAPEEVLRYFRAKESQPSFHWQDVAPEEHAYAFTVARSAGFDILDDVRAALDRAIADNVPFDQFARDLVPTLQAKGWWGRQLVTDPLTGEQVLSDLGSLRRLRTIYWANTRSAWAAGEWERSERNKRFLPYLLYVRSTAREKRPEHLRFVGMIAEVDDPVWDRLYPPNGWNCQCSVRQISGVEARRLGYDGSPPPDLELVPWTNRRTGEQVMVPMGVDPGWDRNPGKLRGRAVGELVTERVRLMPAAQRDAAIADFVASPAFRALAEGRLKEANLPVAHLPPAVVERFGAGSGVVSLSADSVRHILEERAERGLSVADFRQALTAIGAPNAAARREKSVILMVKVGGRWWRAVVKRVPSADEWWLVSLLEKGDASALEFMARERRKGRLIE
jgi:SPP1 gp7 family putative phage head morphogenesis protein